MKIQTIILAILLSFVVSELQYLPEDNNFLGLKGESEVRIKSNCDSSYEFQNSRAVSNPKTVSPGGEMTLKVIGQGTKDHSNVVIRVEALLNNEPAYNREFKTEKGICLGVSKEYVLSKLGKCYKKSQQGNSEMISYRLESPKDSKTKLLERHNMPIYFAVYYFKNNKLAAFDFGFEYP